MDELANLFQVKTQTPGKGRDDDIEAPRLSAGEYVIPADIVAYLGDGATEAGGDVLDGWVQEIREKMQAEMPKGRPPRRS